MKPVPVRRGWIGADAAPVVCLPLVGRNLEELDAEAGSTAAQGADLLEWRADRFGSAADPEALLTAAQALRRATTRGGIAAPPLLVTLRAAREGGTDHGLDDMRRARSLAELVHAGLADVVDLEAASDPEALALLRAACRAAEVPLLLSQHDFERTPTVDEMVTSFTQMAGLGADIAKLAVMPRTADDVTALLEATARADRVLAIPLVSMAMGEPGVASRVIGHRFGSRITWGSGAAASAPGQLPIDALRRAIADSLAR